MNSPTTRMRSDVTSGGPGPVGVGKSYGSVARG